MKDRIEHLANICQEAVSIFINDYHRGSGETIRDHIKEMKLNVPEEIIQQMEKRNMIVEVIAYPRNQVGSYRYSHYDVEYAVNQVIEWVERDIKEWTAAGS